MPTIKLFEELPVWKDARTFAIKIHNLTKKFPKEENYGLTSQVTRATISIGSNIAEGFDRYSKKDFIRFLIIARGSISEIQNDLYIALDLKYINQNDFQEAYALAKDFKDLGKQINGFIKYLRSYDKNNSKDEKINEEYCKYNF
ncbi:MAG: four helix bundle protein [Actinobacteria bacterium]|nr:four helix bundle protein [Actinomycetota bacterium]